MDQPHLTLLSALVFARFKSRRPKIFDFSRGFNFKIDRLKSSRWFKALRCTLQTKNIKNMKGLKGWFSVILSLKNVVLLRFIIYREKHMKNNLPSISNFKRVSWFLRRIKFYGWKIVWYFKQIILRLKCQNPRNPRNIISAKINLLRVNVADENLSTGWSSITLKDLPSLVLNTY